MAFPTARNAFGCPSALGDLGVRRRLAVGDPLDLAVDGELELRPAQVEGEIESLALPLEVLENLSDGRSVGRVGLFLAGLRSEAAKPAVEAAAAGAGKLKVGETPRRGGGEHLAEGRIEAGAMDDLH